MASLDDGMNMTEGADDEKYIVFKRSDFLKHATPRAMNMATAEMAARGWEAIEVKDAVVIRRQDLFASPALATYSACIGMVAAREGDDTVKKELRIVADYFDRQSQLAAVEGYKLPTL